MSTTLRVAHKKLISDASVTKQLILARIISQGYLSYSTTVTGQVCLCR